MDLKKLRKVLESYKYPLLVLLLGLLLLLLPGQSRSESAESEGDAKLEQILSRTEGVGEAKLLISDKGVVIACEGAADARVRLDMIRAIVSYTGLGSDKITILKLAD